MNKIMIMLPFILGCLSTLVLCWIIWGDKIKKLTEIERRYGQLEDLSNSGSTIDTYMQRFQYALSRLKDENADLKTRHEESRVFKWRVDVFAHHMKQITEDIKNLDGLSLETRSKLHERVNELDDKLNDLMQDDTLETEKTLVMSRSDDRTLPIEQLEERKAS